MDSQDYITVTPERKKEQHLGMAERGAMHVMFSKDEMVCTRTLYNMVWAGLLPITPTELPEALKRKTKSPKDRQNKKHYGTSISERPEMKIQTYLAFRIPAKTSEAVTDAMNEEILAAADELNGRPRRKLGYCTPEELFEAFLDAVFAA